VEAKILKTHRQLLHKQHFQKVKELAKNWQFFHETQQFFEGFEVPRNGSSLKYGRTTQHWYQPSQLSFRVYKKKN
jgi:hypothetical protein